MKTNSTTPPGARDVFAGDAWFDPIEAGIRGRIRGFIETMLEEELAAALGRGRYERGDTKGHRHGKRERQLLGSFGPIIVEVPRARLTEADGSTHEWRSETVHFVGGGSCGPAVWAFGPPLCGGMVLVECAVHDRGPDLEHQMCPAG